MDNIAPRAKRMKQQKAQYSAARLLLPVREQDDTLVFLEKRANMARCAFQKHSLCSGEHGYCCFACCLQG